MVYLKKKDYKREKMVLITGTVLIFITAILGSQFMAMGKVYSQKVKFLETKGYELNGTLSWDDYETWSQWINEKNFKGKMNIEYRQVMDWTEFYGLLKEAEKAPIYDDSLYGPIYHNADGYCIWFQTVNSRRADGKGFIQTYVIFPD
ncbi:hypothetical protein E4H04_01915 [Candidatus Bathyarchaeota archaeon]|jgi:hypothetical protein|nr:MAG: hypothetical protein E4H04_01915 [Candidatus Bathyarchaeota archaeon]